ncbi:molecular chaperone HscC [Agrobacterium rhizogenes]|uniref:molecular chaperone HscC n=1 Tax=Rhizobium rhizogenes TaxID=359 RepID=UPI00080FF88C|nr:molecular chaperone HscC [Rhizobium rhizogenes]OCJ18502.1 molecular chaperone HscC [Agrobacterium sp. B131/95]OCJ22222.1 molecular chaperone HscC [Agrobacterium sp. B133/95]NTI46615.1 molecular chaperone HscC [Rhizobium rhizogenes]NTI53291.1 molecular chaperone HscC [Rhizobium rhizogenes]NTI98664.1 molecular chaperone HscC [Rhizobium rhizogenes]
MAIIGIDLGTSNSLAAVWSETGAELIVNALGETLTPSAVSMADDGTVLVGRAAVDRLITHPDRSVASFKRWMGSAKNTELADKSWRPEELSALVLKSLKDDVESALGTEITEAVISVPAYFNDPQRKATLDAARLAGLRVERLINEPTAAALAHGLETGDGRFLILDLGGGTFDVSLLHKYENVMEIRASAGDSSLGGNDFRDVIVQILLNRHGSADAKLESSDRARILREAEALKFKLTDASVADYEFPLGQIVCQGELTRAGFEEASASLVKRMRIPIESAIRDARIDVAKIDQIVLVGGATRMPLIRNLVTKLFGRFPLLHPRPDHAIALGAAVQAGLKHRRGALDEIIMTDVCPFTLGTAVFDPRAPDGAILSPIIERNAIVPISRENIYRTASNGQTRVDVQVLQGEHMRPSQNIEIGKISVPVPPGPAGQESIGIRFTYDINGALEVEVNVTSTGRLERKVFRNQSNLNDEELERSFAALSSIKLTPREQQENRSLIARAERLYAETLGSAREHIAQLLLEFETALKDQSNRDPDGLRKSFAASLNHFEHTIF